MPQDSGLIHIITFCGECDCGCPEVFLEPDAPAERRVMITDDFGQLIQMSVKQLQTIVAAAKSGDIEEALLAAR